MATPRPRDLNGRSLRYVYDDNVRQILGFDVFPDDDDPTIRYIYLFDGEAQWYADNGTIGDIPKTDLSVEEQAAVQQYTGNVLTGSETPEAPEPEANLESFINQPDLVDTSPDSDYE
jgi:hypothetical protein